MTTSDVQLPTHSFELVVLPQEPKLQPMNHSSENNENNQVNQTKAALQQPLPTWHLNPNTTTTTTTTTVGNAPLSPPCTYSSSVSSASSSSVFSTCSSLSDHEPYETYRQFYDASRQERTVLIGKLVDTAADIMDSIWHPRFLQEPNAKVVCTRAFVHEILKRTKTTYSTLQISLFYLLRVKKQVHERLLRRKQSQQQRAAAAAALAAQKSAAPATPPSSQEESDGEESCSKVDCSTTASIDTASQSQQKQAQHPEQKQQQNQQPVSERLDDLICCGRRMFLASLMVASKYLHDKNYRNTAWSKISGLSVAEVNASELAFLRLIDYKLFISKPTFDKWYATLHSFIQKHHNVRAQINDTKDA